MEKTISVTNGKVQAVYSDTIKSLLQRLGHLMIERASDVKWDAVNQKWFAIYLETGQEIARHENRDEVLRLEIAWIEENVIRK